MRGASYLSAPSTPYVPTPPATMCHMLLACDEKKRALCASDGQCVSPFGLIGATWLRNVSTPARSLPDCCIRGHDEVARRSMGCAAHQHKELLRDGRPAICHNNCLSVLHNNGPFNCSFVACEHSWAAPDALEQRG